MTRAKWSLRIAAGMSVGLAALALAVWADAPHGWLLAGSKPAGYLVKIDREAVREGHASVCLQDRNGNIEGFGTLMQQIKAEQYLGKRVRLGGFVKSQDVRDWAGLWMRVDQQSNIVAFDNMQARPDQGHDRVAAVQCGAGRAEGCDGNCLWHSADGFRARVVEWHEV